MQTQTHDVAIIGGGPAGAASAMHLLKAGIKPVILEKEVFPRYHIGESLTGECGAALRRLGFEKQMLAEKHPVKRGVTVYAEGGKNSFFVPVQERGEDNKLKRNSTWSMPRDKFDKMLLDEAKARGADYRTCDVVEPLTDGDTVTGLRIRTADGLTEDLKAKVVIDASGQNTFMANRGMTSKKERGNYDKQVAIFSQLANTVRNPGEASGNTLLFRSQKNHWAWFIPLTDEVTSIGAVVPSEYFKKQKLSKINFLRQELPKLNPELTRRLPDLNFLEEVRSISNYSYDVKNFTGKGFLCVGDSHRFVDPIFSFGVYFALKEAELATEAIVKYLTGETSGNGNPFAEYEATADKGQDIVQNLVDCFWDFPLAFTIFVHQRYTDDITDIFSGRIYGERAEQLKVIPAIRSLLATQQNAMITPRKL